MKTFRCVMSILLAVAWWSAAGAEEETAEPQLLLHFAFEEPITGDGQAVPAELAEPVPCKWGRAVSGFASLAVGPKGESWQSEHRVEGRIGHAYAFGGDEAKRYLRVPMNETLDFGRGDFTIAYWAKSEGPAGMVMVRASTAPYVMLGQDQGGRLRLTIRSEESKQTGLAASEAMDMDGAWHHYAVVADRDGQATFYLDGQPQGGGSIVSNAGNLSRPAPLGIGGYGWAKGYLNGVLDDFRLYRGQLSPQQVMNLANPAP